MRWTIRGLLLALVVLIIISADCQTADRMRATIETRWAARVALPPPAKGGRMSLEETLGKRRSVREFSSKGLSDAEIGQLLWAAQGTTHPGGSAHGTFCRSTLSAGDLRGHRRRSFSLRIEFAPVAEAFAVGHPHCAVPRWSGAGVLVAGPSGVRHCRGIRTHGT